MYVFFVVNFLLYTYVVVSTKTMQSEANLKIHNPAQDSVYIAISGYVWVLVVCRIGNWIISTNG